MRFSFSRRNTRYWACAFVAGLALIAPGCRVRSKAPVDTGAPLCTDSLLKVYYPDVQDPQGADGLDLFTPAPMTLTTFQQTESWDLTLDDAVHMALSNNKILQRLGGTVIAAPQATVTTYEPAIIETNPLGSVEAALSAFDAQVAATLFFDHREQKFNNNFQALFATPRQDTANFQVELSKQTAAGTRFAVRNLTDYTNSHIDPGLLPLSPFRFNSIYNTVNQFEVRQPLLRGNGVAVNRIAGPNAQPGQYNGVMIARIRTDINLADFELAVQDLVRDVERNYWELYFAYRDLDTKLAARESARETWENRQIRFEKGLGRPDEEAQARQQYYNFEAQVQNALSGTINGLPGVLGSERNMRRLLGLTVNDGRLLRPISDPAIAPVVFDWGASQESTIDNRVELRRQKWTIKQRELELLAAKQLNIWRLDMVGQYGFKGFGDNLFGSRDRPEGSAVADLFTGQLDDWQVGFDMQGPLGMRQGNLAVRNAELRLVREKAVLREQQRQILHDLSAAYNEVDRASVNIRTAYNGYVAAREELEPKRLRVEEGKDQVFFLLDAQQRYANAESAFYRAIVDYNQALLNFNYVEGALLARYNVRLDEGNWDEGLQMIGRDKAGRFVNNGWGVNSTDVPPVSAGEFQPNQVSTSAAPGSWNATIAPDSPDLTPENKLPAPPLEPAQDPSPDLGRREASGIRVGVVPKPTIDSADTSAVARVAQLPIGQAPTDAGSKIRRDAGNVFNPFRR